jgi:uncharacterized protein
MIQIGCNYSAALMELLEKETVEVDWIKLSRSDILWEEVALARPVRPILLHTLPNAGQFNLDQLNWDNINRAIEACNSPHIAIHLSSLPQYWDNNEVSEKEIVDSLIKGIEFCKKQLTVKLLIENVPYYGFRGTLKTATEPEVINKICKETDVELLLDLAHLRVAAWHRKENHIDYLNALPLDLVHEIHVCGPAMDPVEGLRDKHLEMQEIDYHLLEVTLEKAAPKFISLEYGGTGPKFEWRSDIKVLERQLKRIKQISSKVIGKLS